MIALGLLVSSSAVAGVVGDVSPWCRALQAATVQVVGDFALFRGDGTVERVPDYRAGSGFWAGDAVVVTANHVIHRMERVRVCVGAEASPCHDVTRVVGMPEIDVAILYVDGRAPVPPLRVAEPAGPGQAIVAGGYPGDVGWVCGPGHLTGQLATALPDAPYLLFEGTVAAEGSSGGPIVTLGRSPRRLEAIGAVSGATRVGSVMFNRAAPVSVLGAPLYEPAPPGRWRTEQPWAEKRVAALRLGPTEAYWEDLDVPALHDLDLHTTDAEGLCWGLFRPPPPDLAALAADAAPIAWSCDGASVLYTTPTDEVVRIGLWTDSPHGWEGQVELLLR